MTRQFHIQIVEVGPRDGLQNEARTLPVSERIALVRALAGAGLRVIEAGSFVSPKRVPQLAGTNQVLGGLVELDIALPVLVANLRGFDTAQASGARHIAVFAS